MRRAATPTLGGETRPRTRQVIAAWLLIAAGLGDGVATWLDASYGLGSPWVALLPIAGVALLLVMWDRGEIPFALVAEALAFAAFGLVLLLAQLNAFSGVNLAGFTQLWLFALLLLATRRLFAEATDGLASAFTRAIVAAHYVVSGYLIASFLLWLATGRDFSLIVLLTTFEARFDEIYGFRPAAFSREPAWAGFALMATYIAVYLLAPGERLRGFVALVLGIAALRSGTVFLFVTLFVAAGILQRQSGMARGWFFLIGLIGLAASVLIFRERAVEVLSGADPSALMRTDSARVAWDVVTASFPGGVGYGNFRDHAVYGPEFMNYINLADSDDYKSDVSILNLAAELGAAGLLLYGWVASMLVRAGHPLLWGYLAAITFLAGGLLIPSVLIVGAVAGLYERQRRAEVRSLQPLGLGRPFAVSQPA